MFTGSLVLSTSVYFSLSSYVFSISTSYWYVNFFCCLMSCCRASWFLSTSTFFGKVFGIYGAGMTALDYFFASFLAVFLIYFFFSGGSLEDVYILTNCSFYGSSSRGSSYSTSFSTTYYSCCSGCSTGAIYDYITYPNWFCTHQLPN